MVCNRCILVVQTTLEKLGLQVRSIQLGEVEIENNVSAIQKSAIAEALEKFGFALIDDKRSRLIEKIKALIIDLVHQRNSELKINLSDFLSEQLNQDYKYMAGLFSEVEGTTLEKYYIAQKIEKVKELLVYDELTLSEIAYRLNYSSVAHLSGQFKKVTGLTPSHFKNLKTVKRKPLDKV
ncbi:MAG: helix-turn-helix transcriptional regulator [Bacteroidetes bacterium]|nr:helix-turn-helix transcriptional regulator [Bacteroidota bacterium]